MRIPKIPAIPVLTLALGISGCAVVYSLVRPMLLSPLPYPDASRLVVVEERTPGKRAVPISQANFAEWVRQSSTFQEAGAHTVGFFYLTGVDQPEQIAGGLMTPGLLRALRVQPAMGRLFTDGEQGVVLLSHRAWTRRFGADPNILGKVIALDWARTPQVEHYQVIGVMPGDFWMFYGGFEVFVPLQPEAVRQLTMVGRLRHGVSATQAQAMLVHHDASRGWQASVQLWQDEVTQGVRPSLLVLSAAVAGLLLIAVANVSGLLLARGLARQKEVAVRLALGAGWRQLARQSLTEALWIGVTAAMAGVALSLVALRSLLTLLPEDLSYLRLQPGLDRIAVNGGVIVFASAIALASCILCALGPLWQASRTDVNRGLRQGSGSGAATRETLRARRMLIAIESAAAVALLFGGGMLAQTMARIAAIPLGFRPDHLLVARVPVPARQSVNAPAYLDEVERRVGAIPGVQNAALTGFQPLTHNRPGTRVEIAGSPSDQPRLALDQIVSSRYFETCGLTLRQGRLFGEREADTRLVVVNEAFVSAFQTGIGKSLRIEGQPAVFEIVGVVSGARQNLLREADPQIYRSRRSAPAATQQITVRTFGDPRHAAPALFATVKELGGVVAEVSTMADFISNDSWQQRVSAALLGGLGWVAFLLTASGVYGTISHMVVLQTRDIGVRVALGAQKGDVARLIIRQGMMAPVLGAGLGIALAVALGRAIQTLLYGSAGGGSFVLTGAFSVVVGMALLACLAQMRRSIAISPAQALRHE